VDDEGNEIVLPKRNKYHLIFSAKEIMFVELLKAKRNKPQIIMSELEKF
jgi:hypothetical protein